MVSIKPVTGELSAGCGPLSGRRAYAFADAVAASAAGGAYALFQEMEEKDAHLFATLQTRKNALLGCPWKVIAGADDPRAQQAALLVEQNLQRLPGLAGALFHLLDALAKGFSVAEVLWQVDPATGAVWARDIRARSQAAFAFDEGGALYLLRDGDGAEAGIDLRQLLPRPGEGMVWARRAVAMPARKFLHFAFQGTGCSPYGAALCQKAYGYYWLKKATLEHWSLFNEKFGSPTAVARYSADTPADEVARLEEVIRSLPRDSGVLLPEGSALEFLEARRSAGANTYRELADWCNDEMSKLVLGQTLTTSEGRRTGSLALGRVHETVRRDYLASDAAALGQVLSGQLARWITDFNLGTDVAAPRVVFDVAPPEQFESELVVDRELIRMGVALPASYFYERYRRPVPREGERTLRYDDANLYQYHLLHGVLTINEVRHTLGLPPVPWGDVPTGRSAAAEALLQGNREADPAEDELETREAASREATRDRRS